MLRTGRANSLQQPVICFKYRRPSKKALRGINQTILVTHHKNIKNKNKQTNKKKTLSTILSMSEFDMMTYLIAEQQHLASRGHSH